MKALKLSLLARLSHSLIATRLEELENLEISGNLTAVMKKSGSCSGIVRFGRKKFWFSDGQLQIFDRKNLYF